MVPRLARDDVAVRKFTLESQRIRPPAIVMQQRPSASTARLVVFASSCPFKYAIATSAPSRAYRIEPGSASLGCFRQCGTAFRARLDAFQERAWIAERREAAACEQVARREEAGQNADRCQAGCARRRCVVWRVADANDRATHPHFQPLAGELENIRMRFAVLDVAAAHHGIDQIADAGTRSR